MGLLLITRKDESGHQSDFDFLNGHSGAFSLPVRPSAKN